QMDVHYLSGIRHIHKEGAKRIVLARESSLELIQEACKEDIEIEVFAYGAICISYSGQCLISSVEKNRSANKGMCAQYCRMKYFKEDGSSFSEGDYILSPKDLNAIKQVPKLIDAGVSSLKIEGRMKSAEYVYLVTKSFREAIDAYYVGKEYQLSKQRNKELALLFNRGFSEGHLMHNSIKERMNPYRPNHRGIPVGKVISCNGNKVKVKLMDTLHQHDGLRILQEKEDIGLNASYMEKDGKYISVAKAHDIVTLRLKENERIEKDSIVLKTNDTYLVNQLKNDIQQGNRKVSIQMEYHASINQPLQLIVKDEEGHVVFVESDGICELAKTSPLNKEQLEESLLKIKDTIFHVSYIEGECGNIFLAKSIINKTRREALDSLLESRTRKRQRQRKLEYTFSLEKKERSLNKQLFGYFHNQPLPKNDYVLEETEIVDENNQCDNYENKIINEVGGLYGMHKACIAGMSLNIYNSYALAYVLSIAGIDGAILSSELKEDQIHSLLKSFEERYSFVPRSYMPIYGRRQLMIIKNGFLGVKMNKLRDLHGKIYDLEYNKNNVSIMESEVFHKVNVYCYGEYYLPR
ncbi:MAG: U32 family peptidase, partial [Solobacterium sp.]|nr:U32 family peptidase [Solobacterium sp.]